MKISEVKKMILDKSLLNKYNNVHKISKGWSADKKYFIELTIGETEGSLEGLIKAMFPETSFQVATNGKEVRCRILSLYPPAIVREVVHTFVEPGTPVIWES